MIKSTKKVEKVNVYSDDFDGTGRTVLGRVNCNYNLDYFDGRDWNCGCTGMHAGLTIARDGTYILIHGSQWQNDRNWAEYITMFQALKTIVETDNLDLLQEGRFKELRELYEKYKDDLDDIEIDLCPKEHLSTDGWYMD